MYPDSYIEFLLLFHSYRDYFECHEVLEEEWRKDPKGNRKLYWVGLIQLAVTLYHYRRGNRIGASKMINKSLVNLRKSYDQLNTLGLDNMRLIDLLTKIKHQIRSGEPFTDSNIPIKDPTLVSLCKSKSRQLGLDWCGPSDMNDLFLINKHKLRNKK